ncbi:MAG TPA: hypothetical protein VN786_00045 [Acidimicrobiales bacterium]|nr:hypothetical protein [Acidimicrobiales bacterium]
MGGKLRILDVMSALWLFHLQRRSSRMARLLGDGSARSELRRFGGSPVRRNPPAPWGVSGA